MMNPVTAIIVVVKVSPTWLASDEGEKSLRNTASKSIPYSLKSNPSLSTFLDSNSKDDDDEIHSIVKLKRMINERDIDLKFISVFILED